MPKSRKRNPGLFRTRKEAIREAIAQAERDPDRIFNRRGTFYVVGGGRRWGVVTLRPNGAHWGPITLDSADQYRRWYCEA